MFPRCFVCRDDTTQGPAAFHRIPILAHVFCNKEFFALTDCVLQLHRLLVPAASIVPHCILLKESGARARVSSLVYVACFCVAAGQLSAK